MTPTQYLRAFWRSWYVIAICTVAGAGLVSLVTSKDTATYASNVGVLVESVKTSATTVAEASTGTVLAQQRVATYADLARGLSVAQIVVDALDLGVTPSELEDQIDVSVPRQTSVIRISAEAATPEGAQRIASRTAATVVTSISKLEQERGQGKPLLRARVIGKADLPATAIAPAPWRNPALGLAGGLAVGLALAVVMARFDRRVRDESAAREAVGATVLGVLPGPRWRPAATGQGYDTKRWEKAVRELRTSVYFLHPGPDGCLTLALTSPRPLEQLPQIAGDVAASLVDAGARVLVVQADLHRGAGTPLLGTEGDGQPGLADYLGGSTDEAVIQHHEVSGVDVVPAGTTPSDPADLLHSGELARLVHKAEQHYDYVLITTAATSVGTDAAAVAARCDGALVVVARRGPRRRDVRSALTQLERVDAPVLGAVFLS